MINYNATNLENTGTELMVGVQECYVRMTANSQCHDKPKVINVFVCSQFLPDFLSPLANLLFRIISNPQRLRLNSLLGCGFMLMASDASSAC